MRLLLDTDAFCKLGIAGLLDAALAGLGVESSEECARLGALPHMLRRGKLPRLYGSAQCESLVARAESIPVMPDAPAKWLDLLAAATDVDPGEAQLVAMAAEARASLLTGDKRALRTVASIATLPEALTGRIVSLEAVLLRMCETIPLRQPVHTCARREPRGRASGQLDLPNRSVRCTNAGSSARILPGVARSGLAGNDCARNAARAERHTRPRVLSNIAP